MSVSLLVFSMTDVQLIPTNGWKSNVFGAVQEIELIPASG
jgi:hypothetical protein